MTPPTPSPVRSTVVRGWLRNPFVWAALAGMFLVTAIRPLTRRVPPPPAVTGHVPHFELRSGESQAFDSSQLADRVYLASFMGTSCDERCDRRLAALLGLQRRCERMGVKLTFVAFVVNGEAAGGGAPEALIRAHGGDPTRWLVLRGSTTAMGDLLAAGFDPAIGLVSPGVPGPSNPRLDWSVLVDGDGATRGAYPTTDDGLYEVFHRAQHVMSLRRAWR